MNTRLITATGSLLLLACLMTAPSALADENNDKVGTRAFPFLKRDVGARAAGLAGAFTGLSDDESALFYNPAGLSGLEGRRALLSYQNFVAGINAGFLAYVHPLDSLRTISGFINYVDYGTFVRTDATGAEIGEFGGSAIAMGGSFAQRISERVQLGASGKVIYQKVDTYNSTGAALDVGVRFTIKKKIAEYQKRGFGSVGLAVQNLGATLSAFTVDAEKDPLPVIFRLGAAGRPRGIPVTLTADAIKPVDNDLHFAVGAEYTEIERLSLRAGWSSFGDNFKSDFDNSVLAGFSFGLGFHLKRLTIDYSLSPMNDLGESHRITARHNFAPFLD